MFEKILEQVKNFKGGPLILIAGILVVILAMTAWFTVQPEETAIVQRFGKVVRSAGPGLHFKLPFGIEKVRLLPTARVLKEEFGFRTVAAIPGRKTKYDPRDKYKDESLMLTGDLNVIDVQWVIQYREHVFGRQTTQALVAANHRYRSGDKAALAEIAAKLQTLTEFYPAHIEKEDKVFFPASRDYYTDEEDQSMLADFWEFDRKMIHEKYESVVQDLET